MRTVVGVLRGGPSSEYEPSLRSGANVLLSLDKEKYEPRDIFIDRSAQWHSFGAPVTPERALRGVDVAVNVVHGEYGEDGKLHEILDALAVPYTGASASASTLAFNKARSKQTLKKLGIKTPRALLIDKNEIGEDIEGFSLRVFRSFPLPAIVKPAIGGSSIGVTIVGSFHALGWALEQAFKICDQAIIEEYIKGREATVGVINNYRGQDTYALLPVEIVPPRERPFFDYEAKYGGKSALFVPGNFTTKEKDNLMQAALAAHQALGTSPYSRSDFIVSRRGIYFLETNNPQGVDISGESLFARSLGAVGSSVAHFLDHVITLSRGK